MSAVLNFLTSPSPTSSRRRGRETKRARLFAFAPLPGVFFFFEPEEEEPFFFALLGERKDVTFAASSSTPSLVSSNSNPSFAPCDTFTGGAVSLTLSGFTRYESGLDRSSPRK